MKTQTAEYKALMAKSIRPPSLLRVTVGLYSFREDEIVSASFVDDIDPLSRRLPTQTFSFTVADPKKTYDPTNPTGKWAAFDKDAKVSVQFGLDLSGTETWLDPDIYWLDGRPTAENGAVTFQASGRLSRLSKHYIKNPTGVQYAAAVESILDDAGLLQSEYDIDSYALAQRTGRTYGFKPCTHAEALQYFAHASGMALYSRGGKVCIQRFLDASDFTAEAFNLDEILQDGIVLQKEDDIGTLREVSHFLAYNTTSETLFEGEVELDGLKYVNIEFGTPVSIDSVTVSGGSLYNRWDYCYAVRLGISGTGTATVTITGKKGELKSSETLATLGGGTVEELVDNPLLNFESSTDLVAAWLLQDYSMYLPKRNTYAVSIRGSDAVEAGDAITFTSYDGKAEIQALVLAVRTEYNGAISTTLTCKEMGIVRQKLSAPELTVADGIAKATTTDLRTERIAFFVDGTEIDEVDVE